MLDQLVQQAMRAGCTKLRGRYLPTDRNGLVADLYRRLAFHPLEGLEASTSWELEVEERPTSEFITVRTTEDPEEP